MGSLASLALTDWGPWHFWVSPVPFDTGVQQQRKGAVLEPGCGPVSPAHCSVKASNYTG